MAVERSEEIAGHERQGEEKVTLQGQGFKDMYILQGYPTEMLESKSWIMGSSWLALNSKHRP